MGQSYLRQQAPSISGNIIEVEAPFAYSYGLCYGNGVWVCMGENTSGNTIKMKYSEDDGYTWIECEEFPSINHSNYYKNSTLIIKFLDGYFFLELNPESASKPIYLLYSADGKTWKTISFTCEYLNNSSNRLRVIRRDNAFYCYICPTSSSYPNSFKKILDSELNSVTSISSYDASIPSDIEITDQLHSAIINNQEAFISLDFSRYDIGCPFYSYNGTDWFSLNIEFFNNMDSVPTAVRGWTNELMYFQLNDIWYCILLPYFTENEIFTFSAPFDTVNTLSSFMPWNDGNFIAYNKQNIFLLFQYPPNDKEYESGSKQFAFSNNNGKTWTIKDFPNKEFVPNCIYYANGKIAVVGNRETYSDGATTIRACYSIYFIN